MHAEVGFDKDSDLASAKARRKGERLQCVTVVGGDRDAHIVRQSGHAFEAGCANGWVGDEQIVAHLRHHFRLAQRRTRQPDRAQPHLLGGDARRLVCFHMRPKSQPVQAGVCRHPVQIQCKAVEIDHRNRRLELFEIRRHHASQL